MTKRLNNKIILVLGASGGIGSAVAEILKQEGAVVCRHGQSGEYGADVRQEKETAALVTKIIKKFERIDAAVNSLSAPIKIAGLEEKSWGDFLNHFNVQLKAAVDLVKYASPHMKAQKSGTFVNIVSAAVRDVPPKSYADYITAKFALSGFSRCLTEELRPHQIGVHCVYPDFVETELTKVFPEKLGEILAEQNKSKRLTKPEDVGKVVADLLAGGGTGKHIFLSGGRVIN